jgi:hypothetical protein
LAYLSHQCGFQAAKGQNVLYLSRDSGNPKLDLRFQPSLKGNQQLKSSSVNKSDLGEGNRNLLCAFERLFQEGFELIQLMDREFSFKVVNPLAVLAYTKGSCRHFESGTNNKKRNT